jgi:leucyl-tRNA synthetase
MSQYDHKKIEENWQKVWANSQTFKAENTSDKPKYYVLDMFPYPSGAGLHVGHPLGYIATDIVARYKRNKGFNVLHPMGYDAFGLPAEQYAIQTGQHPAITTEENIKRYREQLDRIGFSFDWSREIRTSDPQYYKWTQWIFIQLFNSWYNPKTDKAEPISELIKIFETNGYQSEELSFTAQEWQSYTEKQQSDILLQFRLAFLSETMVNWCPALGSVLANDEIKDGVSERGGYPVERKLMYQWSLRISVYAERLLQGLNGLDWTESIKEAQRNWIGKSEGCSVRFEGDEALPNSLEVFTTRPDTIFGVSYMAIAPEHELLNDLCVGEFRDTALQYAEKAKNRSERERQAEVKNITGAFTGSYVKHPFTGKQIPIWIADYVLGGYGTGAVMAVPAHDGRDFAFAKHFGLPILEVVQGGDVSVEVYEAKHGKIINSDFLNGLEVKEAIKAAIKAIEQKEIGKGKTNYRLRDAVFGRQRYWGEPIPVYYENYIPKTFDEKDLPLVLPEIDKYLPTETGEPPLSRAKDWSYSTSHLERGLGDEVKFPVETTTMPGWAGSSWYFLRYMDHNNAQELVSKQAVDYWQNIDLYIGGSEHATGHLLYFRFWTKFLHDIGVVPFDEPAKKLVNQGMIQGVSPFLRGVHTVTYSKSFVSLNEIEQQKLIFELKKDTTNEKHIRYVSKDYLSNYIEYENSVEVIVSEYVHLRLPLELEIDNSFIKEEELLRLVLDLDLPNKINYFPNKFLKRFFEESIVFEKDKNDNKVIQIIWEVEKMSKSKWNVVNPDDVCNEYGADTLRLYEMFLGPLQDAKPWSTQGIEGVLRFLRKLWRLFHQGENESFLLPDNEPTKTELKILHKTIKKATEDIENFSFNTSVSAFMVCVNELQDLKCNKKQILEPLIVLLSPYAPHICEQLWRQAGHNESIVYANWPQFNPEFLVENEFNYPISFNGKVRFNLLFALDKDLKEIENEVLSNEQTLKYLEGKPAKKVIVVKGKIVNVVI